jgi:hypothetical protein
VRDVESIKPGRAFTFGAVVVVGVEWLERLHEVEVVHDTFPQREHLGGGPAGLSGAAGGVIVIGDEVEVAGKIDNEV